MVDMTLYLLGFDLHVVDVPILFDCAIPVTIYLQCKSSEALQEK